MIKLIIFDLDNTALDDNKKLDSNLKQVLFDLKKQKNIMYSLASGRDENLVKEFVDDLIIDCPYIVTNGGQIYQNHKCLYANAINPKYNNDILKYLYECNCPFRTLALQNDIGYGLTEFFNDEKDFLNNKLIKYDPNSDYSSITINQIAIDLRYIRDKNDQIVNLLSNNLDLNVIKNEQDVYCINASGASKGNALKKVCELLNIDAKDVMAFGDNHNDLSMLSNAGISVAPKNADEEVKRQVDYVCEYDNNHDAISHFLLDFYK